MRRLVKGQAGGFKTVRVLRGKGSGMYVDRVQKFVPYKFDPRTEPRAGAPKGLRVNIPVSHKAAVHKALKAATKAVNRRVPTPTPHRSTHGANGNKAHASNTNPPGNAKVTNQSYGPPRGLDAADPGATADDIIAPNLGNTQTLLNADQYSDTAAGLEYDPQIYNTRVQQAKLTAQAPQNLAEISRLYDAVQASQSAAAAQNVKAGASIAGSQDALVQGLVASLGGAANQGAAGVAQAGVDNAAYLRSLDQIQQGTDQNIGVALQAEEADQRLNQGRMDTARASDLAAQLMGLQGQRGAAQAASRFDALKYNNDARNTNFTNAQHIREVNIDTQQQEFQNRIAAQNAIIAARAAGDTHLASQLQNAYALAHPGAVFGKGTGSRAGKVKVTPTNVRMATAAAQKNILVKDPDTGRPILDPRLQHNVKALVAAVNAGFNGLHSTNKSVLAARNRILRMYGVTPQSGWNF